IPPESYESPLYAGNGYRLAVELDIRAGCDVYGDVQIRSSIVGDTEELAISAFVWRSEGEGGSLLPPGLRYRIFPVVSDQAHVVARATWDGGFNEARWDLVPQVPGGCEPVVENTGSCERECQCAALDPRAHCVRFGGGGTSSACEIPCWVDA